MKTIKRLTQYSLATMLLVHLVGCGGSSSTEADNDTTPADTSKYTSLNAASDSSKAAYLDLDSGATVSDSDNWHLSYQKYVGFKSNGGTSGTEGMSVCVAKKYDALYDASSTAIKAEFEKLTRDNTLSDFQAVTKASCADADYLSDAITTQIKTEDWLNADYSAGAPVYSAKTDTSNGWIVRSATKDAATSAYAYARVKVKTVTVTFGATTSRKAVYSVEKWDNNTQTFAAAVDSPEMDFSNTRVYWDLETNTLVSATDNWELSIKKDGNDYPIQVNGGASGTGSSGIGVLQVTNVFSVTDPTATAQVYTYFSDTASGALSKPGDFGPLQYAVGGDNHDMWPTFAVYLFKTTDNRYFKAQVVSNTGADGTLASGNLYVRYAEVQ